MNQSLDMVDRITRSKVKSAPEQSGLGVFVILGIIWRGKWLIALTMGLAILVGGYQAFVSAVPLYRATTVLMLEPREEQRVVDLESVVSGLSADTAVINTEVEVLRSRNLIGQVVDRLNLVEDPEFNGHLREPSFRNQIVSNIRGRLTGSAAETHAPPPEAVREGVISALIRSLSVRNVPLSLVFHVTAQSTSPTKAATIADTVVDQYILNQMESKFEATEQATSWLTRRVADLANELEIAESRVREFSGSINLVSQEALMAQERQFKDVRDRIESQREALAAARLRLSGMQAADSPQAKAAATDDLRLNQMLPQVEQPDVAQRFEAVFQDLLTRAQTDVSRQSGQIAALERSREEMFPAIEQQNADLIQLQQLTREAQASRLLYEHFLTRLKETSAQQGLQQADSRLLSPAVIPGAPSEPRKSMILMMSAMLGAFVGIGLLLLLEARRNNFRTAGDLEFETGYSVMGQIPTIPGKRRSDVLSYLTTKPSSAASEAIRNMRTSTLLSNIDSPPRVIGVSSSLPGEGKTTIALATAQNFAQMGKRTLLIEGDIRRNVFGQYLGIEKVANSGLIAVMTGQISLQEAVRTEGAIGFDVLMGENTRANAADLLSSERFARMIDEARQLYDYVIVDTPPVLIVPDARIISQQVDAMLFVVSWNRTTKDQVGDALEMFESVNQPVSGLVLNNISPKGMKRYGYGGRYGSYAQYGKKYYTS